jgi:hypothetical protein
MNNKQETNMKQAANRPSCSLLHAGFLIGLLFNPENGYIFLRNAG